VRSRTAYIIISVPSSNNLDAGKLASKCANSLIWCQLGRDGHYQFALKANSLLSCAQGLHGNAFAGSQISSFLFFIDGHAIGKINDTLILFALNYICIKVKINDVRHLLQCCQYRCHVNNWPFGLVLLKHIINLVAAASFLLTWVLFSSSFAFNIFMMARKVAIRITFCRKRCVLSGSAGLSSGSAKHSFIWSGVCIASHIQKFLGRFAH